VIIVLPLLSALVFWGITLGSPVVAPKEGLLSSCRKSNCLEDPIEVTLRLSKSTVLPGETVRIKELIPSARNAEVGGIAHIVLRIGRYDTKLRKLVNLESGLFSHVDVREAFDKLPGSLGFSHPYSFDISTPRP
jgi:hypothetical protein